MRSKTTWIVVGITLAITLVFPTLKQILLLVAKLHILGDSAYSAWDHIDDHDFCHVDQVDLRFCGVNGMCRIYP